MILYEDEGIGKKIITSYDCDLERPDRGHLQENRVSMRDSAIVTIEHS